MTRSWLLLFLALLSSPGATAQRLPPTNQWPFDMLYFDALMNIEGYRACGARARPAALHALEAELRQGEARARTRGLDSSLEAGRARMDAVAARVRATHCDVGPEPILRSAQRSVNNFRIVATYGSEGARH